MTHTHIQKLYYGRYCEDRRKGVRHLFWLRHFFGLGIGVLVDLEKISAVVPTWNEAQRITSCVQQIIRGGVSECIVADGGSEDDTVSLAAEAGASVISAAKGRAKQMNAGAHKATGDVLLFVHADVQLPDGFAATIESILYHSIAGAFRTRHAPDAWRPPKSYLLRIADVRSRYTALPYGDQALFLRRQTFDEVGGYPEIALMEDLAFAKELRKKGKIRIAKQNVLVSGRRFESSPIYQTMLVNLFPFAYWLGVPPKLLAKLYGNPR